MISFDALIQNTNPRIRSFRILQDTKCKRQIDDRTFEETRDMVRIGEVYDGEIVLKLDGNIYIFLGYDDRLGYEVYIPLIWDSNRIINITEA
jgi:hypothetical protein